MSDQQQDTEVTLGTGKLLGIFFLLVLLCGVFFSLGYTLGKGSQKPEGSLINTGSSGTASSATAADSNGSVRQIPDDSKTPAKSDSDAKAEKPEAAADEKTADAPELKASPGGAYVVQVAAVSKREDADALQQALQRKQYPVVVTPGAGDKLFHVQIGPFAELKDAETMKTRLASDGYNAIVKK
jgi:cell division septation protein DedD